VKSRLVFPILQQVSKALAFQEKRLHEQDVVALEMLGSSLRWELSFTIRNRHLVKHPLFNLWSTMDVQAFEQLCSAAVGFAFHRCSDDIVSPGQVAIAAYHLISGDMKYIQEPSSSFVEEEIVLSVPIEAWISFVALWMHWTHVGRLAAVGPCALVTIDVASFAEVVDAHPTIGGVAKTYARNYHMRVITAEPPYLHWPNDLIVEHAELADLLYADYGVHLLDKAHLPDMSEHQLQTLEGELRSQKCTLQETVDGQLERVVFVCALRITDENKCVLARLGSYSPTKGPKLSLELPGKKRPTNLHPKVVMEEILGEQLEPIRECITMQLRAREVKEHFSEDCGMQTRYLRTVQYGIVESCMLPALPRVTWLQERSPPRAQWTSMSHTLSAVRHLYTATSSWQISPSIGTSASELLQSHPVFEVLVRGECLLYTWLAPEEFELWQTPQGDSVLKELWSRIDFERLSAASMFCAESDGAVAQNRVRTTEV